MPSSHGDSGNGTAVRAPASGDIPELALVAVHDLVEAYAGDTVVYDDDAIATQVEREDAAARRLFGVLPEDQGLMMDTLRPEFEAGETPEARFARALDAFQPTWQHWGEQREPTRRGDLRVRRLGAQT